MKKIFTLKILLVLALLLSIAKLNAQVHMGADVAPKPFSVLELNSQYKTGIYGGLRLPQLTTDQRNYLTTTYDFTNVTESFGLMIYNLDNNCLEYWNSTRWVSLCLGTASITLEGEPCDYSPTTPIPNDAEPCTYTPVEMPPCVLPSGGSPYQVYLVAGESFAFINIVDESTSAFMVSFSENPTTFTRIAVVRVTNNCTGEFKDFPFVQVGTSCPGGDSFTVSTNTNVLCGSTGAAIAWVTTPQAGMDYIWARNGIIVHRGNYMEITTPGQYTVYAGILGCTNPEPQVITIDPQAGTSPNAPTIRASNYGILCPSSGVTLTAFNVSYPVQWFHNGALYTGAYSSGATGNPLTVSGAGAAGEWFAVQLDNPCGSHMSNILTLISSDETELTNPIIASINDLLFTAPPIICRNSSLKLTVVNASAYPSGTMFEWFNNGITIAGPTTNPVVFSTTSLSTNGMLISVQASNNAGGCPVTLATPPIAVTDTAPPVPRISGNAICGGDPALLVATSGTSPYEWFRDGVTIPSASGVSYSAAIPGIYTVRYKDGNGCWSFVSPVFTVISSNYLTLNWTSHLPDTVVVNTTASFTARISPIPSSHAWITTGEIMSAWQQNDEFNVSIRYSTVGTDTVKFAVANVCTPADTLKRVVVIKTGCPAIGVVSIGPNPTGTKELDVFGNPKTPNDASTTFVASAQNADTYDWYVNGAGPIQSGPSAQFVYVTPTGSSSVNTVYVIARNSCGAAPRQSASVTVRVVMDCVDENSGNFRISGKTCYDVWLTDWTLGNQCMPLGGRHNDFAYGLSFPYTFVGTSYSSLTFEVIDPLELLAIPPTLLGNVATITFRDDIRTKAEGTTKSTALKLTIRAKFYIGLDCRQVQLDVFVQDCVCGCTVNKQGGGTITFMCYNLGVPGTTKILTPEQQWGTVTSSVQSNIIYGDLYQWGRITDGHQIRTSLTFAGPVSGATYNSANGQAAGGAIGRHITTLTGDWRPSSGSALPNVWNGGNEANPIKTAIDPCPPGWRIPTIGEWRSIFRGTATNGSYTLATANKWEWQPAGGGTAGYKISPDNGKTYTLFLPNAAFRQYTPNTGPLSNPNGYYWSSFPGATVNAVTFILYGNGTIEPNAAFERAHGFSVRCVSQY